MESKKLTFKHYLMIGSLIFGMLFGAGNLIFPVHLGQMAGSHWLSAALGFLASGVLLPVLGLLAISITQSRGIYELARPVGHSYALLFMILIYATIGPFFATPRTATVPFTIGFAPHIPQNQQSLGLLIYSAIFFLLVYFLSSRESKITALIGKVLNPVFLVMLFVIFLLAFSSPLSSAASAPITKEYLTGALTSGLLQGYNTMDALAGLAFGVTVVTAIQQMGQKDPKSVSLVTAKSGFFSMGAVALIYLLLILLGAMSLGQFKLSPEGGTAFTQIVNAYAGPVGQAVLATLLTVTCLTTAVGLVAAFAQDFHNHFPKVSYHVWLFLSCLASFLTANFGLETIITWSTPMLMFLYPLSMVLILLSVFSPLFKRDGVVYLTVVVCTVVPAFFDMIVAFPKVVSQSHVGLAVAGMRSYLPLASIGMSWAVPALVGLVVGLVLHFVRRSNLPELVED